MAEATGEQTPGGSPAGEIETLRSAARWLVAASAAIAGVLLAGIQLSGLTRVATDLPRLVVALTACVVGLASVLFVLGLAARVLVHPGWTLNQLAHGDHTPRWLLDELNSQRSLLTPSPALEFSRLYRHQRHVFVAWFSLHENGHAELAEQITGAAHVSTYDVTTPDDITRLQLRMNNIDALANRVAGLANLAVTRRRYHQLVRALWLATPATAASIVVFVSAVAVTSAPRVSNPVPVTIHFTNNQTDLAAAHLPSLCAGKAVPATAIERTLAEPIVVSASDPQCKLDHVRITPPLGLAVPDVDSTRSPPR